MSQVKSRWTNQHVQSHQDAKQRGNLPGGYLDVPGAPGVGAGRGHSDGSHRQRGPHPRGPHTAPTGGLRGPDPETVLLFRIWGGMS